MVTLAKTRVVLSAVMFSVLTVSAQAKEFTPRVGVLVENHSDAKRSADALYYGTHDADDADTMFRPYVGFAFAEQTATVNSDIDFMVQRESYANDTFDTDMFYRVDGFIDYELIPGRLVWTIEDVAKRRRIDVTESATVDNFQNFNILSTGPDVFLRAGETTMLLKARLADVFYSNELTDNQRFTLSAGAKRPLNPVTDAGVEVSSSQVSFESEGFPEDYSLYSVVGNLDREMPWGVGGVRLGYNGVDYESLEDASGAMFEGYLNIGSLKSRQELRLSAAKKFTDPTEDAFDPLFSRLLQIEGIGEVDSSNLGGTGASESISAQGNYTLRGDRTSLRAFALLRDDQVAGETAVSTREFATGGSIVYELTHLVSLHAGYRQFKSNFYNSPSALVPIYVNDVRTGTILGAPLEWVDGSTQNVGVTWHIREGLMLTLGAGQSKETSNDPLRDSTDRYVTFQLDYKGLGIN